RIDSPKLLSINDNFHIFPRFDREALNGGFFEIAFEYRLAAPPHFLSLQQKFFSAGPMHASQLSLGVTASGLSTASAHVILTNRGNVETVAIDWDSIKRAGGPPISKVTTPSRFSTLLAQMDIDERQVALEIDIPL